MSHRIEEKAERVACDLNQGQIRDAANVLRQQVECNPREALAIIQMANQMRDHRSPDHIVVQNGNVFVRDEYRHTQVYAGHLGGSRQVYGRQEDCDPRFPNRTNGGGWQEDCDPRFPNRTNGNWNQGNGNWNQGNGNWNQNPNGNPYHGGFDRYGNRQDGNWNQPDCPPVYRRPDIYPQHIPIPDCYGNGDNYGYGRERRGINGGEAAALIIGGVVLGRVLSNHGNNGNFSVRARF